MFAMLAIAVGYDLRERRIPNALVLALLLSGLAFSLTGLPAAGAAPGLRGAIAGVAAGLALTLPLYALHALGAGDAKLLAALGAWFGPWQVIGVIVLAGIAGLALSILYAIWLRVRGSVFGGVGMSLFSLVTGAGGPDVGEAVNRAGARLPYAAAIACGTGLQFALLAHGGWAFA
jgi:prepilin peptidase CpaA